MKKILSFLLSIVMLASILAQIDFSAFAIVSGDYMYNIVNNEVTIVRFDGNDTEVNIPNSINGYTVTAIDNSAFINRYEITSITIPETVTYIGGWVFYGCSSLKSIIIPENVNEIGYRAFGGCSSLKSISIPAKVTTIWDEAFRGCTSLSEITIPDSVINIGEFAFADSAYYNDENNWSDNELYINNHLIEYRDEAISEYTVKSKTKTIAARAFDSCDLLTEITLPESLTGIGRNAFHGCLRLANLTIPDSVVYIGEDAFSECRALTSVIIPDGVKSLNEDIFENCISLKSVTIPKSVITIDCDAFGGCNSLADVYYEGSKTQWEKIKGTRYPFQKNVTIHYSVCDNNTWTVVSVNKATLFADGVINYICSDCEETKSTKINRIKSVAISATKYTYDGKAKMPAVTVKDSAGKTISSDNYTVTYKNNKNIGIASVIVAFNGNYSGSKTLNFNINPKGTAISKLSVGKSQFTVTWKKQAKNTVGYQVSYSTDKNFKKNVKTVIYDKNVTKATYKKLKKGKTYYVKVRTFQHTNKTVCYSDWSAVKSVKVK